MNFSHSKWLERTIVFPSEVCRTDEFQIWFFFLLLLLEFFASFFFGFSFVRLDCVVCKRYWKWNEQRPEAFLFPRRFRQECEQRKIRLFDFYYFSVIIFTLKLIIICSLSFLHLMNLLCIKSISIKKNR